MVSLNSQTNWIGVTAEGYWTFGQDDVCIDADSDSLLEWQISLEKQ
jgi:hypothetical protein